MCIAIAKPHNDKIIPDDVLRECHRTNPDGMGIAYAVNGKMSVFHEMTNVGKLLRKYRKAEAKGADIIMHFRIATHGEVCERNAHPYWVDKDLVFAHNGTIVQPDMPKGTGSGTISDTLKFNREILRPIYRRNPDFLDEPDIERLIAEYIGGSKLVFLFRSGDIRIINQDKGNWDKEYGAWFSNYAYIPTYGTPTGSCGFGVDGRRVAANAAKKDKDEKKSESRKIVPIKEKLAERKQAEDKAKQEFAESVRNTKAREGGKESENPTSQKPSTTPTKARESTFELEQEILELPLTDEELAKEMVKAKELAEREETYTSDVPEPPHHLLCPCEDCLTWANENLSSDWEAELEVDQEPENVPLGCYTGDRFYCWADLPRKYFNDLASVLSVPRHRPHIDGAVYTCEICGKNLQEEDV